ncbi:hypothetical protein QCA50_012897 [Cerrena zonata]|uniref:Micro-fibrillar-associated protein 1 C-terminal domain-containing protein n=1 Tax=Cerrena zonata TaxID=2478898 RepID=A0AAW0G2R6_9APHY
MVGNRTPVDLEDLVAAKVKVKVKVEVKVKVKVKVTVKAISESDRPMVKPVFLSKSKRQPGQSPQEDTDRLKRITLSKAEHSLQVDEKEVKEDQFDGIQDTDDVDPEAEYLEWMQREYQRYQRDRSTLKLEEDEKDALVRRRLNLEVPSVDEPSADGSTLQLDLPVKRPHPPAKPSRPTKLKLKK